MAKSKHNEVAVGLTVLVVLVLAVYIVVALGDWSGLTTDQKEITVELPYQVGLKGLIKGSPVYLGGAKIGQVTETGILTPSQEGSDIAVTFTLSIPQVYPLRDDCVLAADSNLLGGQVSLIIKDLGREGKLLGDGDVAALHLEGGLEDVMAALTSEMDSRNNDSLMFQLKRELNRDEQDSFVALLVNAAANMHVITSKLKQEMEVDENQESIMAKLHLVLERMNTITEKINHQFSTDARAGVLVKLNLALDKLNSSLEQIDTLVRENKGDISETVASLKKTAQTLEADVPEIMNSLKTPLAKVDALMDEAKITLDHFKQTSQSVSKVVDVNRESIDRMVDNLLEISSNLKLATQEIRRAPWKLIRKPDKKQRRQGQIAHAADSFAQAAERLDTVSLRLQKTLVQGESLSSANTIPVSQAQIHTLISELEKSFQQFQAAEKVLWDELQ